MGPWTRAWDSITGSASTTPGTARMRAMTDARCSGVMAPPTTKAWPLKPRILDDSSWRKPFMIDMVMIRAATASMMALNEISEMRATPPLRRLVRR